MNSFDFFSICNIFYFSKKNKKQKYLKHVETIEIRDINNSKYSLHFFDIRQSIYKTNTFIFKINKKKLRKNVCQSDIII